MTDTGHEPETWLFDRLDIPSEKRDGVLDQIGQVVHQHYLRGYKNGLIRASEHTLDLAALAEASMEPLDTGAVSGGF